MKKQVLSTIRIPFLFALTIAMTVMVSPDASAYADSKNSNRAIFISGLSGTKQIQMHFDMATNLLYEVLVENGFDRKDMIQFSESQSAQDREKWGRSDVATSKNIENFMTQQKRRFFAYDDVFVVVMGHANGEGEEAMFHLPGKDVSYRELIGQIQNIPAKRMVIVIVAPQGHVWIEKLSRQNRIIIAGNGLSEFDSIPMSFLRAFPYMFWRATRFREASENFTVSLSDVFIKTQQYIRSWYLLSDLYQTELAMMDADGDGKGDHLFVSMEDDAFAAALGGNESEIETLKDKLSGRLKSESVGLENPPIPLYARGLEPQEIAALEFPMKDSASDAMMSQVIRFSMSSGGNS